MCSHAGIATKSIRYLANQCDTLLQPHIKMISDTTAGTEIKQSSGTLAPAYGTGEEQQKAIIASCDDLVKNIRTAVQACDNLHLTINSVNGIAPAFRYSEVT